MVKGTLQIPGHNQEQKIMENAKEELTRDREWKFKLLLDCVCVRER